MTEVSAGGVGAPPAPKPDADVPPKTPRWVRVSWIIVITVVTLFIVGLIVKGPHRPGSHGEMGGMSPGASLTAGHTMPGMGH